MTRTQAITIITNALEAFDDTTLEAAAAHIAQIATPSGVSVGDIQEACATDSVLPRELTTRELELIGQSKVDFKTGRTISLVELDAYLDAAAATRAVARRT